MTWNLVGHQWAVDLLKQHIAQRNTRHAYLLTGPQGVGRRTLGLAFAQALNCPQQTNPGEPCGQCKTCQRIANMAYSDLSIVQADRVGGTLRVDQVREIQHSLALAPYEGHYRVALFLRFEEAHASAANALLKTLEEPNPQVILILTASSPEVLLPTITSRCEILRLRPVALDDLTRHVQDQLGISQEEARKMAHLSNGCPGAAIKFVQQPDLLETHQGWLDDLIQLLQANRVERFTYARPFSPPESREKLRAILLAWHTLWRDVLLQSASSTAALMNLEYGEQIRYFSSQMDLQTAYHYLREFEKTLDYIDRNVNNRLALEVLLLNLPYYAHIPERH
jgi:DNA polymerase-3 subunit delta'